MERTVVLIKPEQRRKLADLAEKAHVSVAEIHRRAIDQYNELKQEELEAIELLAETLIESNKKVEKALIKAEKTLDDFLKARRK